MKHVDIVSYGTDRYGRTNGFVYVDSKDVNLEMVRAGLAEVYKERPGKGFDNEPYQKAEDAARRAGSGMWSLGDKYVSPRNWREMNRQPFKRKEVRTPYKAISGEFRFRIKAPKGWPVQP